MSNIAEGFKRGGAAKFRRFLAIAKGSAGELEAQLYVAPAQQYITGTEFREIREMAECTKRLIGGFMTYLRTVPRQPRTRNS